MNKTEKIAVLAPAMERATRDDETTFLRFTDEAPKELIDLFLKHYEVRDGDYDVFSNALDIVSEVLQESPEITDEQLEDAIDERVNDCADYYNDARLAYITIWNQDEVAEIVREHECDIATAGAVWYERAVREACDHIIEWVNETDA